MKNMICFLILLLPFLCRADGLGDLFKAPDQDDDGEVIEPRGPYKPQPIPSAMEAFTNVKKNKLMWTWRRAFYPLWYQAAGAHNEAWDKDVLELIPRWLGYMESSDKQEGQACLAMADALKAKGCNDPMILYVYGQLQNTLQSARDALPALEESSRALRASTYPKIMVFQSVRRLRDVCNDLGRAKDASRLNDEVIELLAAAAADPMFRTPNQIVYLEEVENEWFDFNSKQKIALCESILNAGAIDPYFALLFQGRYHIKKAWEARGNGWANSVTKDGWRVFGEELAEATADLAAAQELRPDLPYAATEMIAVTMAGHGSGTERMWFDKAVAARMDYPQAYSHYLWAMRPRWGGTHAIMYEFGVECLQTGRFDTDVPAQFINAVHGIYADLEDIDKVYKKPKVWPNIKAVCEGILHEPSRKDNYPYWQTFYPVAAWACGQYDEARTLFEATPEPLNKWAADYFERDYGLMKSEVWAQTGPLKETVQKGSKLLKKGQYAAALALFREALVNNADPIAVPFLNERIGWLEVENALQTCEWGRFMPDAGFGNWHVRRGDWHLEADGTLTGTSDNEGLQLFCRNRVSVNAAVRGRIGGIEKGDADYDCGVLMYAHCEACSSGVGLRFVGGEREKVILDKYWSGKKEIPCVMDLKEWNDFEIWVRDKQVTVVVNGTTLFKDVDVSAWWKENDNGCLFGLLGGYWNSSHAGHTVKFRDLQIRGLSDKDIEPAPVPAPAQETQTDDKIF